MDIRIAPETRAALEAGTHMRFLYRAKFTLDSRHSKPVIAWTEKRAKKLSGAMLKDVGREESSVTTQMIMVQLLRIRKIALICFDLCFEECECKCNEGAQMKQPPVHMISIRGKTCHVQRNKQLDARVAAEFTTMQDHDKGPLPYFADSLNPPVYDMGRRVEGPEDGGEPEGWEEEPEDGDEPEVRVDE